MELKMLYQERVLGRPSLWSRIAARFVRRRAAHRADLDLLAMNPHLRRDLGLEDYSR
jgi:hypothetical protein